MKILAWVIILVFLSVAHGPSCGGATYKDALGRTVQVPDRPVRIVSLAPSLTEVLYFLGLGDRIVGVTTHSTYPPQARSLPRVGSYVSVNVERIISLAPDLVIGTRDGNEPGAVRLLDQAGVPVYIVNPRTVMGAVRAMERIAQVCGVAGAGEAKAKQLRERVRSVVRKTGGLRRPLVFLQINLKPIMTVNASTFHHDVIRLAGGRNLAADLSGTYPRMGIEAVLEKRPEVIIISSMDRGGAYAQAKEEWLKWTHIPAARDHRVHLVNSDLIDRPSPRIVQGLEIVARILHPEVQWGS